MILPGISGAFILLLLGKYQFILLAVGELRIGVLALFVIGAVAGIVSFSHLLSWLRRRHHDPTIALLMGFMIGSLNKVWPWKEVLETYADSHGALHPLVERNVLPSTFADLTGSESQLWQAAALGRPYFTAPSAKASINMYTKAGELPLTQPTASIRRSSTSCSFPKEVKRISISRFSSSVNSPPS